MAILALPQKPVKHQYFRTFMTKKEKKRGKVS
jgi:hypothetical protein